MFMYALIYFCCPKRSKMYRALKVVSDMYFIISQLCCMSFYDSIKCQSRVPKAYRASLFLTLSGKSHNFTPKRSKMYRALKVVSDMYFIISQLCCMSFYVSIKCQSRDPKAYRASLVLTLSGKSHNFTQVIRIMSIHLVVRINK